MTNMLIKIDLSQSPYDNDMIHNRWHPDIPMVAIVDLGDDFVIETYDSTDGFIKNDTDALDARARRHPSGASVELSRVSSEQGW
jgi:formamidase